MTQEEIGKKKRKSQILILDIRILENELARKIHEYAKKSPARNRNYRFEKHQLAHDAGIVLAEWLNFKMMGMEPVWRMGEHGKPYFLDGIHFNISHAGDYVVCMGDFKPCGIDIEDCSDKIPNLDHHVLTEGEQQYLKAQTESMAHCSYKIWTYKEGYLKAIGTGLFKELKSFEVIEGGEFIREIDGFQIYPIQAVPGYVCTCYTQSQGGMPQSHQLSVAEVEECLGKLPPAPQRILYCIPYAGGSTLAYAGWKKYMPEYIVQKNLEYPGHGSRFQEPLTEDMEFLITDMVEQIKEDISQNPGCSFAIYGHSMGAMIAYQVSLRLEEVYGKQMAHLFLGACLTPKYFEENRSEELTEDGIVKRLLSEKRLQEEIADTKAFRAYILPSVMADFKVIQNYAYHKLRMDEPITASITVFWGADDKKDTRERMLEWKSYTKCQFDDVKIEGDHFFLEQSPEDLCQKIAERL